MLTRKKFVFFYVTLSFLALLLILHNSDRIIYCVNPKFEVLQTTPKPSFEVLEASTPTLLIDRACECVSSRTRESFDFCYKNPKNVSLVGKRFNCTWLSILEDLKLIGSHEQIMVELKRPVKNDSDIMFVSATSKNHLFNFNEMYNIVHRNWPNQNMILYSLDLTDAQILDIEKRPTVKVRKFDYSKYPNYVENWMEYRFKALILAEAIRDYANVWWIDAHTKWIHPNSLDTVYGDLAECANDVNCTKNSSIQTFINSTHSNYAVLTNGLLDYFPTFDTDVLKTNEKGLQVSAMLVYLARTPFTLEILKWHTLCALEEKCMNPPAAKLKCDIIPTWNSYAGCFRYDQSSINILLLNQFRDHNSYFMAKNITGVFLFGFPPGSTLTTYISVYQLVLSLGLSKNCQLGSYVKLFFDTTHDNRNFSRQSREVQVQ
ncbi:Nucleotide-diphospho-sugar transferase domain-containing protein [Caenorhabditis elegans]|uniref:Nucleotide-diphospho-sugar transferase domain-containing protein n=1 Tax=Caenorhabditis elegans TaxID=6239 RepID=G5ED61_CAEEL|nr:Nucleotide-diphospho-sugar transferase domain-containing protein [Caenorhabditis elegans]CBL87048.1 Nucleotide-diphospho-sugar transferase domain-containing protein [Caenorhabditis elegans]|eukprot:NP_001256669.1 Uncharacterized protein CELE_C06B8.2 [Caenorhabditis elegans]